MNILAGWMIEHPLTDGEEDSVPIVTPGKPGQSQTAPVTPEDSLSGPPGLERLVY